MTRARFFILFAVLLAPLLLTLGAQSPNASRNDPKIPAKLCNDCGFGSKKNNCVKCGRWVGTTDIKARLCNNCGFGSKKNDCVKCGRWVGSANIDAKLCNDCGFGAKKENCVKCGKWTP